MRVQTRKRHFSPGVVVIFNFLSGTVREAVWIVGQT